LNIEHKALQKAKAFDTATLTEIYDQFSPGIYRYAYRLLGDTTLAEDCLADTFSRFLKSLQMGQGPDQHLQAYLYRIAHNWITDHYRRQTPIITQLSEEMEDPGLTQMHEEIEQRLIGQRVRLALRSLTPDQRQVITLKFIEEWDNQEVAISLGKPVSAVKALQHRAIESLRKILKDVKNENQDV
jgi:RNA polymerase sigma-70 factor (ECF subfamily)